ncbi:MAG TPA: NAD(P)-dependent oxidoreductase [Anaeromyxobacteraceae bacterium]|nr:NAD(P)-dependent oxidoreductase [Anaeromyxobacteraceae bacterium]
MRMRIGFLGLGTMGEPMANNLRRAGHAMTVWNRTPSKAEHIVAKGGTLARTPRECATGQDIVFVCLADEKALEQVLDGENGAIAGLGAGSILVDTSTSGVRATRWMQDRVSARGATLISAPVLGSRVAAEKAQLVVVAGGAPQALERARPALHAISARLVELDSPQHAALMKLVVNAVGGAMITGFSEALALGAGGGLDIAKMIETVQASSFHSPIYLMKGEQVLAKDWEPRFAIALAEKDQRLAQEAADAYGAKMPINSAVRRLFADAVESGRGDRDLCAVADLMFDWAGVKR